MEFEAHRFDLVFSVDVIHHVTDRTAAFHEAFRVLRPGGRVCTVTDSEWVIRNRVPLSAYFPETAEIDLGRYPCMGELRSTLSAAGYTEIREELAEWPYRLTDSRPYRAKAFSSLRLIDEDAYQAGLKRLEADLAEGPIRCASRYSLLWGRKTAGGGSQGGT